MEQQTRGTIGQQIELPFMESVRISFQSLMIRFGRSVITTAGITLGIAFLVSVLVNNEVTVAMKESGSKQEITTFEEEETTGISMKDKWLIIMSLIVCVVGIANSMLMAVTERFQEIGTMKCLGALGSLRREIIPVRVRIPRVSGCTYRCSHRLSRITPLGT